MAKPRKGVVPAQFRAFVKKSKGSASAKKKAPPAFLKKKMGRGK